MTKRSCFNNHKVSQLTAELRKVGCFLIRHGARHDIWMNPDNGAQVPVPRHGSDEVKTKTLQTIYNGLFGRKPELTSLPLLTNPNVMPRERFLQEDSLNKDIGIMDVTLYFEKGENNYSCFVEQDPHRYSLYGFGRDADEAERDLFVCLEEIRELRAAEGKETPDINVVDRHFDTPSLFSYCPVTIAALARITGLNASLLRQYACGKRTPGERNRQIIIDGYHRIGQQLLQVK